MNLDEQIGGALRDASGNLPEHVGSWDDVKARGARVRRHRAGRAGVVVLTVLALGAGVFAATRTDDDVAPVITTPRVAGELLARVEQDGVPKLVMLSTADGRVLREISTDPALATFGGVSASADGSSVYLTVGVPEPSVTDLSPEQLETTCSSDIGFSPAVGRVDLATGEVTAELVSSTAPIVSPDARRLAYITNLSTCAAPLPRGGGPTLGVTDLETGTSARAVEGADLGRAIQPIAWSFDASRLVALGNRGNDQTTEIVLLDEFPFDPDIQQLAVPGGFETAAYLADGRLVIAYLQGGLHHIAIADGQGSPTEELFTSDQDGLLEFGSMSANAAGRIALQFAQAGQRTGTGGVVEVWSPGDDAPRMIVAPATTAFGVTGVAWLPTSGPPQVPRSASLTTTTATSPAARPTTIVAANGDLVELDAADGSVLRTIRRSSRYSPALGQLALSPDGTTIAVVTDSGPGSTPVEQCATGAPLTLELVDRASGDARPVAGAEQAHQAFDPRFSPDGTQLAYLVRDCQGNGRLVVLDLATGVARTFAAREGDPAFGPGGVVGWEGDSRHVIVFVANGEAGSRRRVDTESESGMLDGEDVAPVVDGQQLVPLGASGRWAATGRRGAAWQLLEYDPSTGSTGAPILTWADAGSVRVLTVAADASGRHFLLASTPNQGGLVMLYRFSVGDDRPTKLETDAISADW